MPLGHWASPFPFALGGGDEERPVAIYKALRADRPEPLRAEGGESQLEDEAFALAIERCYQLTEERVIQGSDPGKATGERLARWERIYDVTPDAAASESERRAIVSAKHRATRSNRPADVFDAIAPLFATLTVQRGTVADILANNLQHVWPGGAGTTDRPGTADASGWTSALGNLLFLVTHPAGRGEPEKRRREAAAHEIVDRLLPVQVTFAVMDISSGFQLDVELLDVGTF